MKLTTRKKIFFEMYTELIQTARGCELRYSKEFQTYYLVSEKTGIHTLPAGDTYRLFKHWQGFLINQNNH